MAAEAPRATLHMIFTPGSHVIVSGIQPSGRLHLGNYFGYLKIILQMQNSNFRFREKLVHQQRLLFIADLHSLTSGNVNGDTIFEASRQTAKMMLACGIDPEKTILFKQSDIAEHTQLMWQLMPYVSVNRLERMIQWKEKSAALTPNIALLSYPILQAADVLLYNASLVPVGPDQKQHLELTRWIAARMNHIANGTVFNIPETVCGEKISSLCDPFAKMSKSDANAKSCIYLDDSDVSVSKKIRAALTDSTETIFYDLENRPAVSNLIHLYAHLQDISLQDAIDKIGRNFNSHQFKDELTRVVIDFLQPIQARMKELDSNQDIIDDALKRGARQAGEIAKARLDYILHTLQHAKHNCQRI